MIERDLFGTVRLVRHWGRIGTNGPELVEVFARETEAGQDRTNPELTSHPDHPHGAGQSFSVSAAGAPPGGEQYPGWRAEPPVGADLLGADQRVNGELPSGAGRLRSAQWRLVLQGSPTPTHLLLWRDLSRSLPPDKR
jgi:hypothetical protein